jgi:hypothetical protein
MRIKTKVQVLINQLGIHQSVWDDNWKTRPNGEFNDALIDQLEIITANKTNRIIEYGCNLSSWR